MIKLTPEQKYELATQFFSTSWNTRVAVGLVDAVEAEVLRLNGIKDVPAVAPIQSSPYERCQKHLREAGKAYPRTCGVCGLWGPCQFEPQVHTVRATGCPDTMDDTGHFAEVDMPAFLRKQNPA